MPRLVHYLPTIFAAGLGLAWAVLGRAHLGAHEVVELPKLLQRGLPARQLSSLGGETVLFRLLVPEGARDLQFNTTGGTGDADLFVRHAVHPTTAVYDKSSERGGNKEHLRVGRPAPGVWYVLVFAASPYRGVELTATYTRTADARAVPKLLPGPGTYVGAARVQLKTALNGAVVRYTTDGTDPNPASPVARTRLDLTSDTEVRAQTFLGAVPRGPVVAAPYFVLPVGTVTPLQSGVALRHRAGMIRSEALYKITVPPGQQRLRVLTRGGTGDLAVFLRQGSAPTPQVFDMKEVAVKNAADLTVANPTPGDWFILLRGRGHYAGVTLQASTRSVGPDLVVWPDRLEPYLSTETFGAAECEVQEGYIEAGTHRLLRFSTESRNIGGGDMIVGSPEGNPAFEFQACHGHYHFSGFASYRLLRLNGEVAATGRKVSFCLEDVRRWDEEAAPVTKYDCADQGIQVGWSDIYDSGLPGQWINVTGVPAGDYLLEITMNPEQLLPEDDFTNNTTTVPVTIPESE